MKKKVITFIGLLLFIGAVVFNVNTVGNNKQNNELMLENIEALASGGTTLDCWKTVSSVGGTWTHKTYCGDCDAVLCTYWENKSTCE